MCLHCLSNKFFYCNQEDFARIRSMRMWSNMLSWLLIACIHTICYFPPQERTVETLQIMLGIWFSVPILKILFWNNTQCLGGFFVCWFYFVGFVWLVLFVFVFVLIFLKKNLENRKNIIFSKFYIISFLSRINAVTKSTWQ